MKTVLFCGLLLIQVSVAWGQSSMQSFLDSLDQQEFDFFEIEVGSEHKADSIFTLIDTSVYDTQQIQRILLHQRLRRARHDDQPFPYLRWANKASKALSYTKGIEQSLIIMGDSYRMTGSAESISFYSQALTCCDRQSDQAFAADMMTAMALSHIALKDYEKSIQYLFQVSDIFKKLKLEEQLVINYHNLGDVYMRMADTANAIKYLKLSSDLERHYPSMDLKILNTGFLGEIYLTMGKLNKAKEYLTRANNLIKRTGKVPYLLYYNLTNLAIIEEQLGNKEEAFNIHKEVFKSVYRKKESSKPAVISSTRIADYLIQQAAYRDCIYLLRHVETKKVLNNQAHSTTLINHELIEFYENLSHCYEAIGDFQLALNYQKKRSNLIDTTNAIEILTNANELEKKYQSKIDKQEIQHLKDERTLKERNFIIMILSFLGVGTLLLFSAFYYKSRSESLSKKQEIQQLALQNERMINNQLKKQQEITKLEQSIKQKKAVEELRNKISADLHDDVGSILTGIAMQSDLLSKGHHKKDNKRLTRMTSMSRDAMDRMRDIVWAMDSRKDYYKNLIDRLREFASTSFTDKGIRWEFTTNNIDINAALYPNKRQQLYLIAKECMTNIVKHSDADQVRIDFSKKENQMILSIHDNGSTTDINNTDGLGLQNIKKRVATLKGTFILDTSGGFKVTVIIPDDL